MLVLVAPQKMSVHRWCSASEDRSACLHEEPKVASVVPDLNDLSTFNTEDIHARELNELAGGVDGSRASSMCP